MFGKVIGASNLHYGHQNSARCLTMKNKFKMVLSIWSGRTIAKCLEI